MDRKNVRILDFGCGGGSHTWYLAKEGFDVYAFDDSQSAVKKVRAQLEQEGLSADLRVRDVLELDAVYGSGERGGADLAAGRAMMISKFKVHV